MNLFTHIKTHLSILDVIREYATLKRIGGYWKGHCPFHSEKTASFTVSPHKDIFYCFGCHAGGDLITFMAKIENCSPIEAAQHLIERYNISVPESLTQDKSVSLEKRALYFNTCQSVATWCANNLAKNPSVIRYLNDRGITQKSIDYFMIGFFPGGLPAMKMLTDTMKKESILPDDLLQANIIAHGKTIMYSPFENRIIFPIKDHLGRFCGFGGRIYKELDERAKYYNSRETEFFIKGSLLFGLDKAKNKIQEQEYVFLVEGYTDCIAMTQHGFLNTVATLGTACTIEHLKVLSRYAQQIFVLFDGDKAGQDAMLRLTELCWQVNLELKVICLPSGEDPASFLGKGGALAPLVDQAKDIFEFFIATIGKDFRQKTLSQKVQLTQKIIATIKNVPDPLKQDILLQQASATLGIPVASLKQSAHASPKSLPAEQPPAAPVISELDEIPGDQRLEKKLFFAIMSNIDLLNNENVDYLLEYLPNPLNDIVRRLKAARDNDPQLSFVQFFDMLEKNEQVVVTTLLMASDQEISVDEFDQLLVALQKKNWKQIVHNIKIKLAHEEKHANKKMIEKIMQDFLTLKKKIVHKNLI